MHPEANAQKDKHQMSLYVGFGLAALIVLVGVIVVCSMEQHTLKDHYP